LGERFEHRVALSHAFSVMEEREMQFVCIGFVCTFLYSHQFDVTTFDHMSFTDK